MIKMKSSCAILSAMISLVMISCGSPRRVQEPVQQYPNYGGYQPQGQPGYYQQQPQQGYYQQQQPVYQQQYQTQTGADADGFVEVKKSPIEELSLAPVTNEFRAYGEAESANEQLALNAARAQATAALQEKIEVYVKAGLDVYDEEVGVNNAYSLDESTRYQVQTAAKGTIEGVTILDTRKLYNPNTKRYKYEVCVKYNRAGIMSVMIQQSERIRANEKQFEKDMQEAWDVLDAKSNRVSLEEQKQMRQNEMQQNNLDRENQRNMQYQNQQNQYELERQRIEGQNQRYQQNNQQNNQNNRGITIGLGL